MQDSAGFDVTGANDLALALFERAQHEMRCYTGDPIATANLAIDAAPEMVMPHVLKAWAYLLGTEPAGIASARRSIRRAAALTSNEREQAHVAALDLLVAGRWRDAGRALEDVNASHPLDVLALQAGHLIDFYTGDSRMLRDRIARALPAWDTEHPGYHAALAMHAFGLEEMGDYAQAERAGRQSLDIEPHDAWAKHAVAHVMEMQNRLSDGVSWMTAESERWASGSSFAIHLWWHLALFHLEAGDFDEALRLFDGPIYGKRSAVVLDMIDASALLWRLHLAGADVGDRWSELANNWAPLATSGNYAFNDVHAMMAFVATGRLSAQQDVLDAQRAALERRDDNAAFTAEVGSAATRAIKAFGEADYAAAIELLRPIRHYAHRFGGSHAQRDVLDLTLLEAALRAGHTSLARALAAERVAQKPRSVFAKRIHARAETLSTR
jgi:tetratricopeptide (TPR) repeat protein